MARVKRARVNPASSDSGGLSFRNQRKQAERTPEELGYRMPAEWGPHAATWLAWPHEQTDWPGKFAPIPWVCADIVRHLSQVERVRILVANAGVERTVRGILKKAGANLSAVDFFHVPTNRGWIRDFGPIFVRNEKGDRKSTRLNSSHQIISYAVFCLKKKTNLDKNLLASSTRESILQEAIDLERSLSSEDPAFMHHLLRTGAHPAMDTRVIILGYVDP